MELIRNQRSHQGSQFTSLKKKMQMREKEKQREEDIKSLNIAKISLLQDFLNKSEPLSNVWCDCYNLLQKELYRHSILNGLESRW